MYNQKRLVLTYDFDFRGFAVFKFLLFSISVFIPNDFGHRSDTSLICSLSLTLKSAFAFPQ